MYESIRIYFHTHTDEDGDKKLKIFCKDKNSNIIFSAPKKLLGSAYGCAFFDTKRGYVREDLPERIKKFVAQHELYHLNDKKYKTVLAQEIFANLVPGIKDPIGLFLTIVMTITDIERVKFYIDRVKNKK